MNVGVIPPRISIESIKLAVAAEFGVPLRVMTDGNRAVAHVVPRQVAMHLAWRLTPCSSPLIGRLFGRRDHTTVLHADKRITELRKTDFRLNRRVMRLEVLLEPPPEPEPQARPELQLSMFIGPLFDCVHQQGRSVM